MQGKRVTFRMEACKQFPEYNKQLLKLNNNKINCLLKKHSTREINAKVYLSPDTPLFRRNKTQQETIGWR